MRGRSETRRHAAHALLAWVLLGPFVLGPAASTGAPAGLLEDRPSPGMDSIVAALGFSGGASFIENAGQVRDPGIRYYASTTDLLAGFGPGGVRFRLLPEDSASLGAFRLAFIGATSAAPRGVDESRQRSRFYLGDQPSEWTTDVRSFEGVVYEDLYAGIDLRYRIGSTGLKYEFLVAAGADPRRIEWRYEGVDEVLLDADGSLRLQVAGQEVRDTAPLALQGRDRIPCRFELRPSAAVGFACAGVDPTRPLVIDPLLYGTYLGGRNSDGGWSLALDPHGSVYLVGLTDSPNFPTNESFSYGGHGSSDAFILKLDPTGREIVYSTFLGGTGRDSALAVAADAEGNAYVAGITRSPNFPTTDGVFDRSLDGGTDVFVAKLSPIGLLTYTVLVGGSDTESVGGIAVDSQGNVVVTGRTHSHDFPVPPAGPAPQQLIESAQAFVVKLDAAASSMLYSVVFGGERWDEGLSIDLDADDNAYVTGQTGSVDFPTTPGAFDETWNGFEDAFVAKFDPQGSLAYSTFLGGTDGDVALSIVVDSDGNAFVAGVTESPDFPTTTGAMQASLRDLSDAFVAKLDPTGASLDHATYLGGDGRDEGEEIAIGPSGDAFVTGRTTSTDFPTTPGAFDRSFGISPSAFDEGDGFLARLRFGGESLVYGSYLGGRGSDLARDIAVDSSGDAWVAGFTLSDDFPTTSDAVRPTFHGNPDAYVARFRLAPGNGSPWLEEAPMTAANGSGVEPSNGTTATTFTYSVVYVDPDNDPPRDGSPAVVVLLNGSEIPGSPFPMRPAKEDDGNYADGKLYRVEVVLSEPGAEYAFFFGAHDVGGRAASNWPAPPSEGPVVSVDDRAAGPSGFPSDLVIVLVAAGAVPVVALVFGWRLARHRARKS